MVTVTNMILTKNIASLPHYQEGINVGDEMLLPFSSLVPFRKPPIIYTLTGDQKHNAHLYKTSVFLKISLQCCLHLERREIHAQIRRNGFSFVY